MSTSKRSREDVDLENLTSEVKRLGSKAAALRDLSKSIADAKQNVEKGENKPVTVLKLNVGGEHFDVPRRTLLSERSTFLTAYLSNNAPALRDSDNRFFIDRDPATFRAILSHLRGYRRRNMTVEEELMLGCDAAYYQIRSLMEALDTSSKRWQRFHKGPGVNTEQLRLRNVYGIGFVGERFLMTGRHVVTFEVIQSEYVGIGAVSEECIATDSEFHRTRNCCVYYMTGVSYANFPTHKKEENGAKFALGDRITMVIDMDRKVVEFHINSATKCYSCASATRLRPAVVLKLKSAVRLVSPQDPNNVQRPLGDSAGLNAPARSRQPLTVRMMEGSGQTPRGADGGLLSRPGVPPRWDSGVNGIPTADTVAVPDLSLTPAFGEAQDQNLRNVLADPWFQNRTLRHL